MRRTALAAGTVPDVPPALTVGIASDAGFDLVGLRLTPEGATAAGLAELRSALDGRRMGVLEVEVARLADATPASDWTWLLDAASAVRAEFVLAVIDDLPPVRAERELLRLCDRAAERGLTIGLEFMRFTAVQTWRDACHLLDVVDHPALALVVDVLHLARSGGDAAALALAAQGRIGWIQVCDAPALGPDDVEGLAHEARHARLLPGDGTLPLAPMLAALPGEVPVSLEVQSDVLVESWTPEVRASRGRQALHRLLDPNGGTS